MIATRSKNESPVLDVDAPRPVSIEQVASKIGHEMGMRRHEESISDVFVELVHTFRVAGLHEQPELLGRVRADVMARIEADRIYDSEAAQAKRAIMGALTHFKLAVDECEHAHHAKSVLIAGAWMGGEIVRGPDGQRFELTGRICERCQSAPQAYGLGGGVLCADQIDCRWWYCAS